MTHDEIAAVRNACVVAACFVLMVAVAAGQPVTTEAAEEHVHRLAVSNGLTAEALFHLDDELDLALLLSVEAVRIEPTVQARRTLLTSLRHRPHLVQFLHGHQREIRSLAFSPDGTILASADDNGQTVSAWRRTSYSPDHVLQPVPVRLWDLSTGRPLGPPLTGHSAGVSIVAFSPDGKVLASGGADGVRLWDVATGRQLGPTVTGSPGFAWNIRSLAFSPDGKTLATGQCSGANVEGTCDKGLILLWDLADPDQPRMRLEGHVSAVTSLAFSPDGKLLASGNGGAIYWGPSYTVVLWEVATGRALDPPLQGHVRSIKTLAFSPDGASLVSGSDDHTIRVWDVAARRLRQAPERQRHRDHLESLRGDWAQRGWSGLDVGVLTAHDHPVLTVAFSTDGKTMMSADTSNTVIKWSTEASAHIQSDSAWNQLPLFVAGRRIPGRERDVPCAAFSPDGSQWAFSGCGELGLKAVCVEGQITLASVETAPTVGEVLPRPGRWIESLAISPDGKLLATASRTHPPNSGDPGEGNVYLWDLASRRIIGPPLVSRAGPMTIAFNPDGKTLAVSNLGHDRHSPDDSDGMITIWDLASRKQVGEPLAGHPRSRLTFSPDGNILATTNREHGTVLWNLATRRPLGQPLEQAEFDIAFSPDGKLLAAGGCVMAWRGGGCTEGIIRFWDVATLQLSGPPIRAHAGTVSHVAFSPDGKTLVSATGRFERTMLLWDVATRQPIDPPFVGRERTHRAAIALSPDGRLLVTRSQGPSLQPGGGRGFINERINLWDVATRRSLGRPLTGPTSYVKAMSITPDGRALITAGWDEKIIIWDLAIELWQSRACRRANRNLTLEEWQRYLPGEPYRMTCPDLH